MAKRLLKKKDVLFENINVDFKFKRRDEMIECSGRTSVPQIFIGDLHVGGFDDLSALDQSGELDRLLGIA
jgi:glutaredoxin 3